MSQREPTVMGVGVTRGSEGKAAQARSPSAVREKGVLSGDYVWKHRPRILTW